MNLDDFIRTYNDALSVDACATIIERFEDDLKTQKRIVLPNHRSFTEINISVEPHWKDVHDMIVSRVQDYQFLYLQDCGIDARQFPENYGFEGIRIKRYEPYTDDEFQFHVDVGNHSSARRFLVFFWYLNTVNKGGETTFQVAADSDNPWCSIAPYVGKLLVFPPTWQYPHTGRKPISNTKYIIGTYLHYL